MDINIKYCNNVEEGNISVKENSLNIKYAINGTGKTTITKAIINKILNKDLLELKPFKYQNDKQIVPEINGVENIKSVKVFDETYINQFVFLENEAVKDSFNIFVKNEKYELEMKEINNLLEEIKKTFQEDETINELLNNLKILSQSVGKSKTGYAANSVIGKGLGTGNKVENIPEGLEDYSEYLKSSINSKWLKWQFTGKEYLDITNKCPYCTSTEINKNRQKIETLSQEYDPKVIEHLNSILDVFNNLDIYFNQNVKDKIQGITRNINGITTEQANFLIEIKKQIDILIDKLEKIKNIGYISLKDTKKMVERIHEHEIDIEYLEHLKSQETTGIINVLNGKLEKIIEKAGILQGKINKQNENIKETIEMYDREINDFLKCAGIKYNVEIELDTDNIYRMKLRHNDFEEHLKNPKAYLSYGEKNAFALILFMYESIKENVDLVILDDPISSFDKNKKFAIINTMFRGKNSFMNKTVLMLTHDFEPIIDMKYVMPDRFNCNVKYLENNKGKLIEKEVKKQDIHTFLEIAERNIQFLSDNINKLIYLRRYYEIKDKNNLAYDLVSSLLHKRKDPTQGIERILMTSDEIQEATKTIREKIPDFDYMIEYNKIVDDKEMIKLYKDSSNNYEKLQIYRIINDGKEIEDDVVKKFINETFHTENDYVFQLNPCEYEVVPQYVIEQCDVEISKL